MKTKIQIKSILGSLLFEFEKENNTIKDTLTEAITNRAYLRGAYLQGADLQGADLRGADLQGAYLRGADLRGADLRGADLQGADLRGVDLQGVDLRRADLQGVDIEKIKHQLTILPEGELVIWKKLKDNLISKLLIPIKAKRVNAFGSRKCRFEYAKVIAIYDGKKKVKEGIGQYNSSVIYKVGEIVKPDSFDDSPLIECSHGIHGFITRKEAEEY